MTKACSGCSTVLSFDAFYRRSRYGKYAESAAGYSNLCKPCTYAERQERRRQYPDKVEQIDTNSRLKRTYGIDLNEYNRLFTEQNGCCAGCKTHQSQLERKLSVDHDHKTGTVRGLLCVGCNLILGYAKDKPTTLENLITYLNKSSELAAKSNVVPFKASTKVG